MLSTFFVRLPVTMVGMGSSRNIGDLVNEIGAKNALIVTDANITGLGLIDNIKSSLEKTGCTFDIFDGCTVGASSSIVESCSQMVGKGNYDLLIGVGGGSVLDTVKAVSVMAPNNMSFNDFVSGKPINRLLPKLLVPTTSGTGSEWSRTGVYHDDDKEGEERVVFDNNLFATAAVVDPELTLKLPPRVTADTGMDALAHAIEAYISPKANIFSDIFAESAIKLISENLRLAYIECNGNPEVRYKLSVAASIAMGAAVASSTGIAHIMSSEIAKRTHIPHGEIVMLLLPHTLEFNLPACPERLAKIAELMGEKMEGLHITIAAQKAIEALKRLSRDVDIPQKLGDLGITKSDIYRMADSVIEAWGSIIQTRNQRLVTRSDIVQIYAAAL